MNLIIPALTESILSLYIHSWILFSSSFPRNSQTDTNKSSSSSSISL
uniref:Uncharacterized protein n=1 Tax=Podoviridae sp. ct8Lf7 TaxID=2827723 RepID=A0A8S5S1F5_9CAUD|nr:MAG TPA: hypothetical protein [Podoviridae sp. ct8Lf7]